MQDSPIKFTNSAVEAIKRLLTENDSYKELPLRVYVEGKGCDGFTYGVAFDPKDKEDQFFEFSDFNMVIDPVSLQFLKDSEVEWVEDERGTGFLVHNPNQKKFRGKFYKRKNWQERLIET